MLTDDRGNRSRVAPAASSWAPFVCAAAILAVGSALWIGNRPESSASTSHAPAQFDRFDLPLVESSTVPDLGPGISEAELRANEPANALWPENKITREHVAQQLNLSVETIDRLIRERSLSLDGLTRLPERKLQRALFRLQTPKADEPGEAIKWRALRWKDENGVMRPDGLANAIRQREAIQKATQRTSIAGMPAGQKAAEPPRVRDRRGQVVPANAGLSPTQWEWLGPGNIGGRTRALLIDPTTPTTYYAGAVGGGIWKSLDRGAQWQPLTNFSANLAVASLAMSPLDSNIIYAGTGEGFFNADAIRGAGIYVTTNGGNTWNQLPSTNTPEFYYVNRLAISPNGATLLAATGTGLYRSTDGGLTWTTPTGGVNVRMLDCDFHPTDSNRCICSTSGARVWFSSNAGAAFTAAAGLTSTSSSFNERAEVCYARQNPATIYCSVDRGGGTIFRSTDNGANFSQRGTSTYLGGQGWYDNIIWAGDPTNVDRVIVGGIDLWRSTDGGATVTRISTWQLAPSSAHADHHEIITPPAYDGTGNQELLFGNDGGVYRGGNLWDASAANVTWLALNNNYGVTQFYGGDGNVSSGTIVGGTQDNGTNRFLPGPNATQSWLMYIGGDGGFCSADQTDPNYFYGEYQWLGVHRSSNGGASATYIAGNLPEAVSGVPNFIAPILLDPNNPLRLLAGGRQLWATVDARAANVLYVSIKPATASNSPISAIAINPRNSSEIWVGHNNGDIFFTSNGTSAVPTWVQLDGTLPNRYCERIAVDPRVSTTIYATFGGFNPDNVWKSTNGGTTWTNISAGLPAAPMNGICAHPTRANWIYVGSEVGVFGSEDGGLTWSPTNEGPLNVAVDEVRFIGGSLLAVTHGRGMYRITPSSGGGGGGGGGGFVNVSVVGNTLRLDGDAENNTLSVTRRASRITVQAGGGTRLRVNGAETSSWTFTATGNINIDADLLAGNDSISLTSLKLDTCDIQLGVGADKAVLNFCRIGTSLINGGVDTDTDTLVMTTTRVTSNQNSNFP